MNPMNGQTVVITGASSGIGAATARQLHAFGANVVAVGRSPEKTRAVANSLGADYFLADFARLSEVRALGQTLLARYPRIDVLMNNAGALMGRRTLTEDGHERTFQVNYLAQYLLTSLLMPRLIESKARIINSSSTANNFNRVSLRNLESQWGYTAFFAYCVTKLMGIMHAKELQQRYGAHGISAVAFHPGIVATSWAREGRGPVALIYNSFLKHALLTPEQGADTMIWLASKTPDVDWLPGGYYANRSLSGYNPQANDGRVAQKLWEISETMTRQ